MRLNFPRFALTALLGLSVIAACTAASLIEVQKKSPEIASKEAAPAQTTPATVDEFSWLEERDGERALEWVREQNERT